MGQMIAQASIAGGGHMVPLLRMGNEGRLTLYAMPRGCRRFIMPKPGIAALPALVVIGDDDWASSGPPGFPAAVQALRWARAVVFNAAGGQAAHYAATGELTLSHRAVVLVETSSAQLPAWQALAAAQFDPPGLPTGFTVMAEGGPHPQRPAVVQ
jgi:hypothetical protein